MRPSINTRVMPTYLNALERVGRLVDGAPYLRALSLLVNYHACHPLYVDIRGMLHLAFLFRYESMTLLLMYVGYVLIMVSNEPGNPFLYRDLLKGTDRLLLRGDEATHQ